MLESHRLSRHRMMINSLITRYDLHDDIEGGIKHDKKELLYGILRAINPLGVYEVGFNIGGSAIVLCEAVGEGVPVYSFELKENKKPIADYLMNEYKNLNVVFGDSCLTVSETLKEVDIGFAFIDGGHLPYIAMKDLTHALEIVSPGGYIAVDDYNHEWIREAVNSVEMPTKVISFTNASGIGIYQKDD